MKEPRHGLPPCDHDECPPTRCVRAAGDCAAVSGSEVVLELKLPVPVKELAAVTDALCKIHGKNRLFMRQVGDHLQLYKPQNDKPSNAGPPGVS